MPNELISIELKSGTLEVKSFLKMTGLTLQGDRATGYYRETLLADGKELTATNFTVDRSISAVGSDLADLVAKIISLFEGWRQSDNDLRAADKVAADAEAIRWAALTPEEKLAERDAKRAELKAAEDAAVIAAPRPIP